jgi:hypothetical protein
MLAIATSAAMACVRIQGFAEIEFIIDIFTDGRAAWRELSRVLSANAVQVISATRDETVSDAARCGAAEMRFCWRLCRGDFSMDVRDAVASRYSCRAFLPIPVPEATVREIIERAARAPSGGNLQAWRVYVISGARVEALKALLAPRMGELPKGEGGEYQIFPTNLQEPYRSRRFGGSANCFIALSVWHAKTALAATANMPGTFNSSARRSAFSLPSTSPCYRPSGPTSAALSRP